MHIGTRHISRDREPYVIAEIGVNHDGELGKALLLCDEAANAGCEAVKLQCFRAELLMSRASRLARYQETAGETDPLAMLKRLELPLEKMAKVIDHAHARGLHAIVTVFSVELVAEAARLPWDAFKTASPDIVHRPLLEALLATGKPLIVSTGASTAAEVQRALGWLESAHDRLALLQCVSCYPCKPEDAAIEAMSDLASMFSGPVGYSDHTSKPETATRAALMGASVLEKHITLDRTLIGPDHSASLEPPALRRYVREASRGFKMRADYPEYRDRIDGRSKSAGTKLVLECESDVRAVSRQSIVLTRGVSAGETITREMIAFKRPGTGMLPYRLGEVVGRRAARAIEADVPVMEADLA
jgi:N,N'-diacetyllegionaminate synthase